MRSSARGFAVCGLVVLACSITGCGGGPQTPPNPVGFWVSTDGLSTVTLNDDQTGSFTACSYVDPRRYSLAAPSWPATLPVTWESAHDGQMNAGVTLWEDWEQREKTGVGFDAVNPRLYWVGDDLQLGVDLVVTYRRTEAGTFTCSN